MKYLPIAICLGKKRVIVVGGGSVAERKIKTLLAGGASLTVVSFSLTEELKKIQAAGKFKWQRRAIRQSDVSGADVAIAATNNQSVNEAVSRWAEKVKALVNVVDKPAISDFISPAILRVNKAIVAVYTDAKDPVLSRDLKNFLEEKWDEFLQYRNRP